MYYTILFLFIFFTISGTYTIFLFYSGKINPKYLYPAAFAFIFLSLLIYILLPIKSDPFPVINRFQIIISTTFTIVFLFFQFVVAWYMKLENSLLKSTNKKLVILAFMFYTISTLPQEYFFRLFMYDVSMYLSQNLFVYILIASILFSIAHTGYKDKLFIISSTIFGIAMNILYLFVPNILVLSVVHSVIGLTAIYLGFVRVDGEVKLF